MTWDFRLVEMTNERECMAFTTKINVSDECDFLMLTSR